MPERHGGWFWLWCSVAALSCIFTVPVVFYAAKPGFGFYPLLLATFVALSTIAGMAWYRQQSFHFEDDLERRTEMLRDILIRFLDQGQVDAVMEAEARKLHQAYRERVALQRAHRKNPTPEPECKDASDPEALIYAHEVAVQERADEEARLADRVDERKRSFWTERHGLLNTYNTLLWSLGFPKYSLKDRYSDYLPATERSLSDSTPTAVSQPTSPPPSPGNRD